MAKKEPYKDWIVRYYANHDDIPPGHTDGELTELIRCRECKHRLAILVNGQPVVMLCGNERNDEAFSIDMDDYCSRAERKEE